MNHTDSITALVITYNESTNIRRTLAKLTWLKKVLVVDSGSTDDTLSITAEFPNVHVVSNSFQTFAKQCNFGLAQIESDWVLSIDADYVLTDEVIDEIKQLDLKSGTSGYQARFTYCIEGHRLRASLYPPRTVLYKRESAHYEDEGHGHRVRVSGDVKRLTFSILHDDRKPLSRWFSSQIGYANREATSLLDSDTAALPLQDRIRKKGWIAPWVVFGLTYFGKGLCLDGWPGLYYSFQRLLAEVLLSICLIDERLKRGAQSRSEVPRP